MDEALVNYAIERLRPYSYLLTPDGEREILDIIREIGKRTELLIIRQDIESNAGIFKARNSVEKFTEKIIVNGKSVNKIDEQKARDIKDNMCPGLWPIC